MKIFFIYHKDVERGIAPHLYAFTTNKSLAKDFMEQRNRKMFEMIEHDLDKSSIYSFINKHPTIVLERRGYYCRSESIAGYCNRDKVYIVSTAGEEMRTVLTADKYAKKVKTQLPIDLFSDDIREHLHNLGFKENGRFDTKINLDEFYVFLKIYGGTLDDKFTK